MSLLSLTVGLERELTIHEIDLNQVTREQLGAEDAL